MFDGSDTSIGGDGEHVLHEGYNMTLWPDLPLVSYPPANGGGCVTKGPFAGLDTHLGPVALTDWGTPTSTGVENPTLKNTRCLSRDLNSVILKAHSNFRNTTNLILQSNELDIFQAALVSPVSLEELTPSLRVEQGKYVGGYAG